MTNFNKSSGFITLTVTLVIILLVTVIVLMTGKMLSGEQRNAANELRYREAMAAAQAGLDQAIANLLVNNASRTAITNTVAPYYQVTFGSDITIPVGNATLPVVQITAVGTAGYSASAATSTDSEARAVIYQQAIVGKVVSGTPSAPLTVAAGMAAGGNFSVAANPNGGGSGVPLSIWSAATVNIGSSSSTCGQQEYYDNACSSSPYSDNTTKGSDILDNDPAFPPNLLTYVFGVSTINELVQKLSNQGRSVLANCSSLNTASSGLYIVKGNCTPSGDVGTTANPVVLVVWNGDLTLNANRNFYGLVFAYVDAGVTGYDIKLNGGATVHGALVSNYQLGQSNGTYNAVYDATVLQNISQGSAFSYIARVPGSWRDW